MAWSHHDAQSATAWNRHDTLSARVGATTTPTDAVATTTATAPQRRDQVPPPRHVSAAAESPRHLDVAAGTTTSCRRHGSNRHHDLSVAGRTVLRHLSVGARSVLRHLSVAARTVPRHLSVASSRPGPRRRVPAPWPEPSHGVHEAHRASVHPTLLGAGRTKAVEGPPLPGKALDCTLSPAASYSPTPSRVQYHRRWRA